MLVFYWAEHIRLLLKPPNDYSSGLLDLSKLSLSDVKLASPKFIMHAECNYGQMMGIGATFKPPWIFYVAWKLVAPLMDARIRQSVKFLSTYEELEAVFGQDIMKFVQQHGATDSSQCDSASDPSSGSSPKHSTSDKWRLFTSSSKASKDTNESKAENHSVDKASPALSSRITSLYTPPVKGENDLFHQDSKAKQQAIARRKELELAFEEMTMTWIDQLPQEASNASALIKERDEMGYRLIDAFWMAEPYTRVRSVLHRLGNIKTPKPFFPSPDSGIEADSSISASDLSK
ncbi:hypothetical protein BGW42_000053 [Actinomortierella wolfii]|nr:hypothetical protein BGW42_000053 [Actinomortierella wolfii]